MTSPTNPPRSRIVSIRDHLTLEPWLVTEVPKGCSFAKIAASRLHAGDLVFMRLPVYAENAAVAFGRPDLALFDEATDTTHEMILNTVRRATMSPGCIHGSIVAFFWATRFMEFDDFDAVIDVEPTRLMLLDVRDRQDAASEGASGGVSVDSAESSGSKRSKTSSSADGDDSPCSDDADDDDADDEPTSKRSKQT